MFSTYKKFSFLDEIKENFLKLKREVKSGIYKLKSHIEYFANFYYITT